MSAIQTGLLPIEDRDRELLEQLPSHRVRFRPARGGECEAAGLPKQWAAAIVIRTAPSDGFVMIAGADTCWRAPEAERLMDALDLEAGKNGTLDTFLAFVRPEHLTAAADRITEQRTAA